jgi:hypothetical protein
VPVSPHRLVKRKRIHLDHRRWRQTFENRRAQPLLEPMERRPQDPLNLAGRGRLDAAGTAVCDERGAQVLWQVVVPELGLAQPLGQLLAVLDRGLVEAQEAADLGPVILDGAAGPLVPQEVLRWDADLPGYMRDDAPGYFVLVRREPAFILEDLQEEHEAQARGTGLVRQQPQLVGRQRPILDQLVR